MLPSQMTEAQRRRMYLDREADHLARSLLGFATFLRNRLCYGEDPVSAPSYHPTPDRPLDGHTGTSHTNTTQENPNNG